MDLLYVSFQDSGDKSNGVNRKIAGQITAFNKAGLNTTLVAQYGNGVEVTEPGSGKRIIENPGSGKRRFLCKFVAGLDRHFDVCYVRFQFFCPNVLKMLKSLHSNGTRVIMEIPTYPYESELIKQGLRGIPKLICDRLFRRACTKQIDSYTAPLYSQPIYGRQCICISNGIDFSRIGVRTPVDCGDTIHMLAVALMAPWHGYERVIKGLRDYYAAGGKRDIKLHLVGDGAQTPFYRSLCEQYALGEHVIFHGKLYGDELESLYNLCRVGISSLGTFRKGAPLKCVEYIAKGLPVICLKSEFSVTAEYPYKLYVPLDESPVDIQSVSDFCDSIYSAGEQSVIDAVRSYGESKCDIHATQRPVIDYILK